MDYFVTYPYQIDLAAPVLTFGIIFTIILILIGITCKNNNNSFFDTPTTASLRGIAVLFLIFGHFAGCLKQKMFFYWGGYWAVIIFLFISGYGLYQKYQFNNIRSIFWKKRISNLYPALWVTLVLFIFLDYFLLNLCYPLSRILLSILGIHLNEIPSINPPVWFIQYIMMQYLIYWLISKLPFSDTVKLIGLFVICFCIAILVEVSPISGWCKMWWTLYTIAFPVGVLFGKYQKQIRTFITEYLNNKIFLLIPLIISLVIFSYWDDFLPDIFYLRTIKPLALIIPIILSLIIYERINLQSTFLVFLGNYSYEIYLLHFPFMVKYDFFLFRDPLYIFFFAYFVSLLILSYILSKTSILINNNLSILGAKITNKIRKR
jgi:peptidoglycan/LPS O-acetylase OafA/YrhL